MFGALKRGRFRSLASLSCTCSECCWRTSTEKNTCGIARFPCGSTAFLFGIRSNISPKLLELETSNLVSGFDLLSLLFDCRVLHTMVHCEAVRSAILATAWLGASFSVCLSVWLCLSSVLLSNTPPVFHFRLETHLFNHSVLFFITAEQDSDRTDCSSAFCFIIFLMSFLVNCGRRVVYRMRRPQYLCVYTVSQKSSTLHLAP